VYFFCNNPVHSHNEIFHFLFKVTDYSEHLCSLWEYLVQTSEWRTSYFYENFVFLIPLRLFSPICHTKVSSKVIRHYRTLQPSASMRWLTVYAHLNMCSLWSWPHCSAFNTELIWKSWMHFSDWKSCFVITDSWFKYYIYHWDLTFGSFTCE
jgi:hypothetical protein